MSESANFLMLEFLSWISSRRRTYAEAMNAWQSTCPRHTIWEDAIIGGLVQMSRAETVDEPEVTLTPAPDSTISWRTSVPSLVTRCLRVRYAATLPRRETACGPLRFASAARSSAIRSAIGTANGSLMSVVRYSPRCGATGASVT